MGLQDTFETIANNSCYALCLSKFVNPDALRSVHMSNVILGWRKDYIADDGTVLYPNAYLHLIDPQQRYFNVSIVNGAPTSTIAYPTFYSIDGKTGHFVLANRNGITWNSLDTSRNVNQGKIRSYRLIQEV